MHLNLIEKIQTNSLFSYCEIIDVAKITILY